MTSKRQHKKIARQLPPVGTTLTATYRGQGHTAVIVEARDRSAGRAVKYGDQLFASLSAAGKAVTGHPTNGWAFGIPLRPASSSRLRPWPKPATRPA